MAKEVETRGKVVAQKDTPVAIATRDSFFDTIEQSIGVSPLAVGRKFTSDDLVDADFVQLLDYDFVDYDASDEHVHFAVWRVSVENDGEDVEGYYESGTVLTKVAHVVHDNKMDDELHQFGIPIKCDWGKTSSGNRIILVNIVR